MKKRERERDREEGKGGRNKNYERGGERSGDFVSDWNSADNCNSHLVQLSNTV